MKIPSQNLSKRMTFLIKYLSGIFMTVVVNQEIVIIFLNSNNKSLVVHSMQVMVQMMRIKGIKKFNSFELLKLNNKDFQSNRITARI